MPNSRFWRCDILVSFQPFLPGLVCCSLGLSSARLIPSQGCSLVMRFFCHYAMCRQVLVWNVSCHAPDYYVIFICGILCCLSQIYSMESPIDTINSVWLAHILRLYNIHVLLEHRGEQTGAQLRCNIYSCISNSIIAYLQSHVCNSIFVTIGVDNYG